jgi:hypothetical protein
VDGRVKLTDFGIARNVAERTLTSTGIMLGSPAYIAPEVAAGREVTPAADLWGFGATLFAVIEGRPPYDVHGAVLQTVNQVVNGEVPRPTVDGPLSDIVAALMVKDPAKRISLREVRNRLHSLLPPPSTPLLPEEDLARLNEVAARWAERATTKPEKRPGQGASENGHGGAPSPAAGSTPLAADPGPLPSLGRSGGSDALSGSDEGATESGAQSPADAPLAAEPGPLPSSSEGAPRSGKTDAPSGGGARAGEPSLAPSPGPLPFDVTEHEPARAGRGAVATGVTAFLAVLLFFAAAVGGFALSRYVGGESILPPEEVLPTVTTTTSSQDQPDTLSPRSGNAGGGNTPGGGGFSVPVPRDWVEFVEPVDDGEFVPSTRVYYSSPDGTQLVTVERFPGFYPGYEIEDYLARLEDAEPGVAIDFVYRREIPGLDDNAAPEVAWEWNYRATANGKVLAPNDPVAQDQSRATFARVLPYAGDLWVVSVTVPIDQEDSGNTLFERIVPKFQVTG